MIYTKAIAIIPARMASSRFPGKPLVPLLGLPMIEHVYRRVAMCSTVQAVYVATCDVEIRQVVEGFGGQVIMTSPEHQRASDRVAEAAGALDTEIVVMVQGDEPMIVPAMVEEAVVPIVDDPQVGCVNLVNKISSPEEYADPNIVKVVMDRYGDALYFSREPIPTRHMLGMDRLSLFKQVCVIPFRYDFLLRYSQLEQTPLEQAESIDMLRLLEHGYNVRLVETRYETYAVDTSQDLVLVEEKMRHDPLTCHYLEQASRGGRS